LDGVAGAGHGGGHDVDVVKEGGGRLHVHVAPAAHRETSPRHRLPGRVYK
jgi:hypothetical protein